MCMKLTDKENALLTPLLELPPDWGAAENLLQSEHFTSDEITRVAIEYADACDWDATNYASEHNIPHTYEFIPNLHSSYLCGVISLLLPYGLNPNAIYEGEHLMKKVAYVNNELVGADALALLLENGGDYMLCTDDEPFFKEIDFHVFFASVEQYHRPTYASLVHLWMVMIGYGARCGEDKMQVFKEFDKTEYFSFDKLRNHRDYYFGLSHLEGDYAISIYDKDTLWEVARIK